MKKVRKESHESRDHVAEDGPSRLQDFRLESSASIATPTQHGEIRCFMCHLALKQQPPADLVLG